MSHALKRRDKSVRQYIEIITARSATSRIQAVYRAGLPVNIVFLFI